MFAAQKSIDGAETLAVCRKIYIYLVSRDSVQFLDLFPAIVPLSSVVVQPRDKIEFDTRVTMWEPE